jgi:hypothetical protein
MQAIPQKAKAQSVFGFDWMFSPWQDFLYFFLPVPFAFLLFCGAQAFESTNALLYAVIAQEVIGLGAFHQGATWFHFLDKDNRGHYFTGLKGKLNFVVVPLALFFSFLIGEMYVPALAFLVYVCWSLNHAVQQNIGIMLLYQNGKAQDEAKIPRDVQVWSQRWMAVCFSLLFFKRMLLPGTELAELMWVPIGISGALGVAICAAYIWKVARQVSAGKYLNMPGFLFWLVCITYLLPFGFIGKNYDDAVLIPLVVHWCQYIGINYVVARRKYENGVGDRLPLQRPVLVYVLAGFSLVTTITVLAYFQKMQGDSDMAGKTLRGMILGLGMVHYYLDGFIWRFREKFPREAMLPYLVRR